MKPTADVLDPMTQGNRAVWSALIVGYGILLSTFYACVTPFAALATVAALKLGWRIGLAVLGLVWLANQAIGYGYFGYPRTWDSLAWGVAIGASAILAMVAAISLSTTRQAPLATSLPLVAAFTAFELTLYTVSFVLPAGNGAFTAVIVSHIFLINAATLCALMITYHLTIFLGRYTRLDLLASTAAGAASSR